MDSTPSLVASEDLLQPLEQGGGSSRFDLHFLRWSLVVDGIFTATSAWATKGWHIYLGMNPRDVRSGSNILIDN